MFSLIPWRKERNEVEPRSNVFDPLNLFRREFDVLFDRFLGPWPAVWSDLPYVGPELEETDKEMVVKFDAPGFEAKDFNIELMAEQLKIVAEHKTDDGKGKEVTSRRLQHYFKLPAKADSEKVTATYRNGVLELRLGKIPEAEGKKIEVKV